MTMYSPGNKLRRGEWLVGTRFVPKWVWSRHSFEELREYREPIQDDVPGRILSFRRRNVPVPTVARLRETNGKYICVDSGITTLAPVIAGVIVAFALLPATFGFTWASGRTFNWYELVALALIPVAHVALWIQYLRWWTTYEVVTAINIYVRQGLWYIVRNTFNEPQINHVEELPKGGNWVSRVLWTWLGVGQLEIFENIQQPPIHIMTNIPNPEAVELLVRGLLNIGAAAAIQNEHNTADSAALLEEIALEVGVPPERIAAIKAAQSSPEAF